MPKKIYCFSTSKLYTTIALKPLLSHKSGLPLFVLLSLQYEFIPL